MPTQTGRLSNDVLNAALAGLEAQRGKIDEQIEQVRSMLGLGTPRRGRPPKAAVADAVPAESAPAGKKRRRFSAETRARMRAAQQKRWAAIKQPKEAPAKAATKKRRLSAAGRKRIIEATKKRWAEYKAKKAAS
jgi:hypothetical protein